MGWNPPDYNDKDKWSCEKKKEWRPTLRYMLEEEGYTETADDTLESESIRKTESILEKERTEKTEKTDDTRIKPDAKTAAGIKNKAAIAIEEIEAEAEKKTSKLYDFKTFDLPFIKGDDFDL